MENMDELEHENRALTVKVGVAKELSMLVQKDDKNDTGTQEANKMLNNNAEQGPDQLTPLKFDEAGDEKEFNHDDEAPLQDKEEDVNMETESDFQMVKKFKEFKKLMQKAREATAKAKRATEAKADDYDHTY